ncbi:MAG: hypothetical protein JWQ40_1205 [Segetibacter sp.]|nr:hypothetical protein [Segetibacter sp.]
MSGSKMSYKKNCGCSANGLSMQQLKEKDVIIKVVDFCFLWLL